MDVKNKNIAYFQSLAITRASLVYLKSAFSFLILLTMILPIFYSLMKNGKKGYSTLFTLLLVSAGVLMLIGIASLSKKMLYKFEIFFTFVLAVLFGIMNFVIMVLTYGIAITDFRVYDGPAPSDFIAPLMYLGAIYITTSIIVHIWLLQYRLKVGFSERRINQNYQAVLGIRKSIYFPLIILAVLIIKPNIFEYKYLVNLFGLVVFTIVSTYIPGLFVEVSYLAYIKTKSNIYLEREPQNNLKNTFDKTRQ